MLVIIIHFAPVLLSVISLMNKQTENGVLFLRIGEQTRGDNVPLYRQIPAHIFWYFFSLIK